MPCILLVDDDSALRGILRLFLQEGGYGVIEAENGRQALASLAIAEVLLTDIVMPEQEGLELIRVARHLRAALPIIAMSGASLGDRYLAIARHLGADCTLEKPFSCNRLLDTVKEALESRAPPT